MQWRLLLDFLSIFTFSDVLVKFLKVLNMTGVFDVPVEDFMSLWKHIWAKSLDSYGDLALNMKKNFYFC